MKERWLRMFNVIMSLMALCVCIVALFFLSSPYIVSRAIIFTLFAFSSVWFFYGLVRLDYQKIRSEGEFLKDLLEKKKAAIEAASDGIGIIDADGNLTYMNQALKDLHGIEEDDVADFLHKSWMTLYTEKGRTAIKEQVMPFLLKNGYWRGNSPIVRKDGSILEADMSLTLLSNGGLIGTARDISETTAMGKQHQELEQQFYQAQKMEAVGRLAGGIAHDFNNILAAMNGYAQFLLDDLENQDEQQSYARNILQAGVEAKALVDQMLAFSRRDKTDKEEIDLADVLHKDVSMLTASLPKTIDLSLNIEVEPGDAWIEGNYSHISQTVMNLCVNARDAFDEDERGSIVLTLYQTDPGDYFYEPFVQGCISKQSQTPPIYIQDDGPVKANLYLGHISASYEYWAISVKDTGSGMSRIIMENIFEPFFTTKPVEKGTGLGLATVHGVVASHGGALMIKSELGQGTEFILFFPKLDQGLGKKRAEPKESALRAQIAGRALLIEDQENVRMMTETMLERMGLEVDSCENGLDALMILRDCPDYYDFVITDQNMPKMTGLELIQQINVELPHLPFILLSGYSEDKMKELLEQNDAVKIALRKPVSKDELYSAIIEVQARYMRAA